MRRSWLVAAALFLPLTVFALPANAGKPNQPQATTTIEPVGTCSFLVTYTWSGFSGSGLDAEVELASNVGGGAKLIYGRTYLLDQAGASGSFSAIFTLTGAPTASASQFLGSGLLFKIGGRASIVRNSYAESSALPPEACGTEVTITIP